MNGKIHMTFKSKPYDTSVSTFVRLFRKLKHFLCNLLMNSKLQVIMYYEKR